MKICITLGTRPEIIKMSPVVRECERLGLDYFIIHTGQHYTYNMDKVFFEQLELPEAKYNLDVGSGSHGEQTGKMLIGIEKTLQKEKPDIALVEGDTNTVLSGALAAAKLHIKVGHVEAGLRSYDRRMPEEINRLLTDHCSDYLFAPTEKSRQIFGFFFLTILPGLLVLQILKLNKIGSTEKFVLLVGLSISFLMFFGLLINNLSLSLGYETPLATIPLLIAFNIAFIALGIMGYKLNKEPIFPLPNIELSTSEKAFLIVPILFPALSIFGMHVMNTTDNNIILMLLLFLIPIYVAFICFFNQKFSKRLYPVVIFLISISLLLLMALKSNHLIGIDTHEEYYLFQTTLDNLHWRVAIMGNALDACLSISLLCYIKEICWRGVCVSRVMFFHLSVIQALDSLKIRLSI